MNILRNVFAALFVGEMGYFGLLIVVLVARTGLRGRTAIGIGALVNIAASPVLIFVAIVITVGAYFLFSRH